MPQAVLTRRADRYEKRHKNLAAHVSPAFRAEVGDIVTVGEYGVAWHGDDTLNHHVCRSMPTPVEDRAVQCCPSEQEQGRCQGVRQVLDGCLDGMLEGLMVASHCILFVFFPCCAYICHTPKMITAHMRLYEEPGECLNR